jgi:hypothetical protein
MARDSHWLVDKCYRPRIADSGHQRAVEPCRDTAQGEHAGRMPQGLLFSPYAPINKAEMGISQVMFTKNFTKIHEITKSIFLIVLGNFAE